MHLKTWILTVALMLPAVAAAQVSGDVDESIEQWVEETGDDASASELNDQLLELRDMPVNINDTLAARRLPLISPFMEKALRNYILLYGQLESVKELYLIPGFDSATVEMLKPYIVAKPIEASRRWRLNDGHVTMVSGIGGTVEQAAGYQDGRYEGDNLRAYTCFNYNYRNKILLRLAYDKDPGEAWGKNNFIGYHLMLNDMGRLEKLIVGRYNLQFGQGVTLWTGFAPFRMMGQTPVRFGGGVRAASTFYEQDYQEGVAATLRLGRSWHASAFASSVSGEKLMGGHLDYRRGDLIFGATVSHTALDDSNAVSDLVYNQDYFRGRTLTNVGVDAAWQYGRLLLYGEAAVDDSLGKAVIAGARYAFNSHHSLGINCHHYDARYHNLHAEAHSVGSTWNEEGVSLDAKVRLPLRIDAMASLDLHSSPGLRYGSYSPSSGDWLRAQLRRQIGRRTHVTVRYAYRRKERNIPNVDSTLYLGESTIRQQLQVEASSTMGHWTLRARAIATSFDSENGVQETGWLALLDGRYSGERLQINAGASYFDINGYYARIYLNESHLQYAFSMPTMNGQGVRAYIVVRYSVNEHLAVNAKYGLTLYADRESIGSGAAQIDANHQQTWMIQVRLKY